MNRYELPAGAAEMVQSPEGEWVRLEEIKPLLLLALEMSEWHMEDQDERWFIAARVRKAIRGLHIS